MLKLQHIFATESTICKEYYYLICKLTIMTEVFVNRIGGAMVVRVLTRVRYTVGLTPNRVKPKTMK
jgi:hypothetical protein